MANRVNNLKINFDDELRLSEDQTTVASEHGEVGASDATLDLGVWDGNIDRMVASLNVGTITAVDETYVFTIESSDDSNFATINSSYSITVDRDDPNRSYVWSCDRLGRYMRLYVTVGGSNPSVVHTCVVGRLP